MTAETGTGRRSRAARLTAGLLGGVALLVVVGFLVAAGVVVWIFDVALPAHRDRTEATDLAANRRLAATAAQRLQSAAGDGALTDPEITGAVGRLWALRRGPDALAVTARFPAGSAAAIRCYTFTLPLPLSADTAVRQAETRSCPEVTAHT